MNEHETKKIHIVSGGTMFHVAPHFALCAPAYGATGNVLKLKFERAVRCRSQVCNDRNAYSVHLHETRMVNGSSHIETNTDVEVLLSRLANDPDTAIIVLPVALCDFEADLHAYEPGAHLSSGIGKERGRLDSTRRDLGLALRPAPKLIDQIRRHRKDIFLVGFKTTTDEDDDVMFTRGLSLMKRSSCNLVFVNDIVRHREMIVTPEQARYMGDNRTTPWEDRNGALESLVWMTLERAQGTFTRTTVADGPSVAWDSEEIPSNLRRVVDHCISRGAYRTFEGKTVGHFAVKLDAENEYATSRRKSNFNTDLHTRGLVRVRAAPDGQNIIAFGDRPSVGGQSQRIIFRDHPDMACIVHVHCPMRPGVFVSRRMQMPYECGSHQCGQNTSDGLMTVGRGIMAVMLDNHGPNVVFSRDADPDEVIRYIEDHFDLTKTTRGYATDAFESDASR